MTTHVNRWWKFWSRVEDTTTEAQTEMVKLEERDPEVARLSAELQEIKYRNNFSGMVDRAIRRSVEGS